MKTLAGFFTTKSKVMKTFKIELVFTDPYIAQRNGGDRTIESGLSHKEAKKYLLDKHNELFDRYYCTFAGAVKYYNKHKPIDGLYKSEKYYRLDYDSRIFKIETD